MKLFKRLFHGITMILPYIWGISLIGIITMFVVVVLTALIRIFLLLMGVM